MGFTNMELDRIFEEACEHFLNLVNMSKIDKKQIKHVAKLASLPVSDEELEKYAEQLGAVVDYVSELEEVDTQGVQPTSQTTGLVNVIRKDEVDKQEILDQKEALSQAAEEIDGYFAVSMILKEKDLT